MMMMRRRRRRRRRRYTKSTCEYFMILALFGHRKVEQIQQRLFDRQEPVRMLLEAALAIEAYEHFLGSFTNLLQHKWSDSLCQGCGAVTANC